jgi:SH3 domain-containing YSC84-like protein 1
MEGGNMKNLAYITAVLAMTSSVAAAEINSTHVARLSEAAKVLAETSAAIPQNWDNARCVAVIPDLKKAALIFGGEYGKGVMSCRSAGGWSAPVFLELAKGSWGFQAGAEEVDVVLLVMNETGVQKLMKNKVTLGADASVAAGPVGRQGNLSTDATLTAEILAYSRAKGLFAGINLSGGVLRPDEQANRDVYGASATASTILASRSLSAPTEAAPFIDALAKVSTTGPASTAAAPEHEIPPQATAAVAESRQGGATSPGPAPSGNVPSTTDSDLRATIVAMQQTLDGMLANQNSAAPVGTSGQTGASGATVSVSRESLERLRSQLNSLLAALNARGQ